MYFYDILFEEEKHLGSRALNTQNEPADWLNGFKIFDLFPEDAATLIWNTTPS